MEKLSFPLVIFIPWQHGDAAYKSARAFND